MTKPEEEVLSPDPHTELDASWQSEDGEGLEL